MALLILACGMLVWLSPQVCQQGSLSSCDRGKRDMQMNKCFFKLCCIKFAAVPLAKANDRAKPLSVWRTGRHE